ncbi:MAG: nitrate/nitrite transporter [Leptospirales bacterium]
MGKDIIKSLRAGHPKTLFSAFLYFDVSFMIWMLISALSLLIGEDLHLTAFQKGVLVALPLLGGAFFRIVLGLLSDQFGPKRVGIAGLVLTLLPLVWGWEGGKTFLELLGIALLLGISGASFAVALPLASRWYPPESQGVAMGVAGAGNSGTLISIFLAPMLAITYHFGWHGVFGLAIIPVLVTLAIFSWFAEEAPRTSSTKGIRPYLELMKVRDLWWFCLFYSTTFGGFVGLTSYLNILYYDHYGMSFLMSGKLTALAVFLGSFFRPLGGYIADQMGGLRLLILLFSVTAFSFIVFGWLLPPIFIAICFISLGILSLGMGNGAIFQLIPQRFPSQIGIVSGIVGASGGLGGFFLPMFLGSLRDIFHIDGAGFIFYGLVPLVCGVLIFLKRKDWEQSWLPKMTGLKGSNAEIGEVLATGRVPMEVVFGG